MLFTLAFVIFIAAIIVFFSQEFVSLFKKILVIRGAKLLVPLAIASWAVYAFEEGWVWLIYYFRECFHTLSSFLMILLPVPYSADIAMIVLFTAAAILPLLIWDTVTHKRAFMWYQYSFATASYIWLVTVMIILIV